MSAPSKLKEATARLSALTDTLEHMADRRDEIERIFGLRVKSASTLPSEAALRQRCVPSVRSASPWPKV